MRSSIPWTCMFIMRRTCICQCCMERRLKHGDWGNDAHHRSETARPVRAATCHLHFRLVPTREPDASVMFTSPVSSSDRNFIIVVRHRTDSRPRWSVRRVRSITDEQPMYDKELTTEQKSSFDMGEWRSSAVADAQTATRRRSSPTLSSDACLPGRRDSSACSIATATTVRMDPTLSLSRTRCSKPTMC